MSADARSQATAALDDLVKQGALGAALIGRDGLPVLTRSTRPVQEETFSAMAAALLGAAEAALQELAEMGPATAYVEAGGLRLAVTGLDDQHLLVLAAPSSLDAKALSTVVEGARTRLRKAIGS